MLRKLQPHCCSTLVSRSKKQFRDSKAIWKRLVSDEKHAEGKPIVDAAYPLISSPSDLYLHQSGAPE